MEKRGSTTLAFFRLISLLGMAGLVIRLILQLIDQVSWNTLLPVLGLYAGYKVFCITLDIIKLIVKLIVIILIVCLVII